MVGKKKSLLIFILSVVLTITLIPDVTFASGTASAGQITGFVPLETDAYYYEGDPTEVDITSRLPETIDVYLNGSSSGTSIEVHWEAVEDFDATNFYFYSMRPVWSDAYALAPDLNSIMDVPWITVYKQDPLSDDIEPMRTEDQLDPISIDEEQVLQENGLDPDQMEPAPGDGDSDDVEQPVEESDVDAGPDSDKGAGTGTDVDADTNDGSGTDSGAPVKSMELTDDTDDTASEFWNIITEETYAASTTKTDKVYDYLTNTMGLNMAAACGVMTNINAESGMSPINLENIYNTKFGLSDKEYTKRVNKGKGAYKTKSGAKRNFKTDYCGYGLCQWTSLGRRKKLLKKALKKDVSIGNLKMQMGFLNDELEGSYSSVMNTLKSVPDNAQGAYIAAFVFCMNFEVPANTLNTAAARGKTCISKGGYWEKYSGKAGKMKGKSFLSISGYTYPITLKTSKGMTVKGYAISNYKIKKVKAYIKDRNGVTKYKASAKPYSTVYSLYNFDKKLLFSKLDSGTYKYYVYAKDSSGEEIKEYHKFTVSGSNSNTKGIGFCMAGVEPEPEDPDVESTMDIYSFNYPTTLKKGEDYEIKGKIKSNYNLVKAKVKVVNEEGAKVLSASKKLDGTKKSYNVKNLNSKINFGKLTKGKYTYKVIGTDTKEKKTLVSKPFTVK